MFIINYISFSKSIINLFFKVCLIIVLLKISNFAVNNLFLSIMLLYSVTFGILIQYNMPLGIIAYLLIILFQSTISYYLSTPLLSYIDEMLIFYLTALTIGKVVAGKKKFSRFFIYKYFYLFIILMFLSIIINQVPFKNFSLFLISIIKPILLFFVVTNLNNIDVKRLGNLILFTFLGLGLLQIPFIINNIINAGGIMNAIGRSYYYVGDYVTGTFRSSDSVGYLIILDIIIMFFFLFDEKRSDRKSIILVIFLSFCLTLFVASVKRLFFIFPSIFIISFVTLLKNKQKYGKIFIFIVFLVLFVPIFITESNLINQASLRSLDSSVNPLLRTEKIKGYFDLFEKARFEMPFKSLGAGPGMYGSAVAQNLNTPFAEKYINYYMRLIPSDEGGTLMTRSSSIIMLISEMGIISLLLVLAIFIHIFYKAYLVLKKMNFKNNDIHLYAFFVSSIIPLLIFLMFFEGVHQSTFIINIFWCFCGMLYYLTHTANREYIQ